MKELKIITITLLVVIGIMFILDHSYQRNVEDCVKGGNTITYCKNELSK